MCIQDLLACLSSGIALTTPPPCGCHAPSTSQLWPFYTSCQWRTAPPSRAAVCLTQSCVSQAWRKERPTSSTCGRNVTDSGSRNILTCVLRELIHPWSSLGGLLDLLWTEVSLRYYQSNRTSVVVFGFSVTSFIQSDYDILDLLNLLKLIHHVSIFVASVELQFDFSMGLTMVVPWSLPEELQDDMSEPRAKMGKIFKDKVGEYSLFTSVMITDYRYSFHPS